MPLHVWLKEPQMQVLVKGDRIIRREWRKRRFGLFPRRLCVFAEGGSSILFDASNVLLVKTVTEEEVEKAKVRAEEEAKRRGADPRVQPAMMVPGMKRAGH